MFYFYIIRSLEFKKLYLGFAKDLKVRLGQHNGGENASTKPYIPYELIYYSAFKTEEEAIACEAYFKTTAGWKRLKRMLFKTMKWWNN